MWYLITRGNIQQISQFPRQSSMSEGLMWLMLLHLGNVTLCVCVCVCERERERESLTCETTHRQSITHTQSRKSDPTNPSADRFHFRGAVRDTESDLCWSCIGWVWLARVSHTHTHHIAATHHMYTHNYKHIQHHEHPHQAPRTLHDVIAEGCDSVLRKTLIAHACSEYL